MVDLLKVPLLAQLIVRGASLLCDDAGLVQLFLQDGELVRKLGVLAVNFRDLGQSVGQRCIGL